MFQINEKAVDEVKTETDDSEALPLNGEKLKLNPSLKKSLR